MSNCLSLRIALIAPLIEAVPPPRYGGTERVVALLADELVRRGHAVTLFASGDSVTRAHLVPGVERSLRASDATDYTGPTLAQLGEVYRRASEFDVIHNHVETIAFPYASVATTPTVTTVHLRMDSEEAIALFRRYPEQPLVSISDAQRAQLPDANWLATVHHGIPLDHFDFRPDPGEYLVFLGRMSPEKRPDRAIEIARRLDLPLVMAGKVDPHWDGDYFDQIIAPMIAQTPMVEFIGEVDDERKNRLLGGALAYLFPIDWPEPFGLTLIEAMATGTPVIAKRVGSVPELVMDGVTGFTCTDVDQMVEAASRVRTLDRKACRAHVELNFSPAAMTSAYERTYRRLIGSVIEV